MGFILFQHVIRTYAKIVFLTIQITVYYATLVTLKIILNVEDVNLLFLFLDCDTNC